MPPFAPVALVDPLDLAVALVKASPGEVAALLGRGVVHVLRADWSVALPCPGDGFDRTVGAVTVGEAPSLAWVSAFLDGARTESGAAVNAGLRGPSDVAWAICPQSGLGVVAGRARPSFRRGERRQLLQLSRIADARLVELGVSAGIRLHPSSTGAGPRTRSRRHLDPLPSPA
jgi:hypothetical protein